MVVTEVRCRTLVNRTGGYLEGFTHTINPYHGCAYGNTLCGMPDYAPAIVGAFGERRAWGDYLDVKINAPQVYAADHDRIRGSKSPALRVYMSSVTDPYVPQERRYRVTRRILEAMLERPPDLLALQTHTPNPLWDEDLLVDLSRRVPLSVQISVETDREDLGPPFRRHAYPVSERIDALSRLRARGLETVAVVSPLWPIEDVEGFARRLEAAASYVILDHFLIGDGSRHGERTRARLVVAGKSVPDLLVEAGYGEWTTLEALEKVRAVFEGVLGPGRLGISREGFIRAAHRLVPSSGPIAARDAGRPEA
jgi:DNA repair photolyase